MNQEASAIVVDVAKELIQLMQKIAPGWSDAYFRFSCEPSKVGSIASFRLQSKVSIIDPFRNQDFFLRMNGKAEALLKSLGKAQGVLLLVASSDFKYEIKFDFENLDRWKITKLNGGTGLPEGL